AQLATAISRHPMPAMADQKRWLAVGLLPPGAPPIAAPRRVDGSSFSLARDLSVTAARKDRIARRTTHAATQGAKVRFGAATFAGLASRPRRRLQLQIENYAHVIGK